MGLNKIVEILIDFNNSLEKVLPQSGDDINILFQSIRELIDNSIYVNTRGNNNRYPYYEKNHKTKSILMHCVDIIEICKKEKLDKEMLFKKLVDLYTLLKWFQWYISDSRKHLSKIILRLEKDINKDNKE